MGIGAEAGIGPSEGSGTAFGATAKYLHGIGTACQLTLTAGALFDSYTEDEFRVTCTQIPVLVGYCYHFYGHYVEPQLGYMSTRASFKVDGQKLFSGSDSALTYAACCDYAFENGINLGVSFRNSAKSGYTGAILFRAGFNFSLGGK